MLDVLIIAETSLIVYPASYYVNYYRGNKKILINLSSLQNEENINYVLHEKVGEVFKEIDKDEENIY